GLEVPTMRCEETPGRPLLVDTDNKGLLPTRRSFVAGAVGALGSAGAVLMGLRPARAANGQLAPAACVSHGEGCHTGHSMPDGSTQDIGQGVLMAATRALEPVAPPAAK